MTVKYKTDGWSDEKGSDTVVSFGTWRLTTYRLRKMGCPPTRPHDRDSTSDTTRACVLVFVPQTQTHDPITWAVLCSSVLLRSSSPFALSPLISNEKEQESESYVVLRVRTDPTHAFLAESKITGINQEDQGMGSLQSRRALWISPPTRMHWCNEAVT